MVLAAGGRLGGLAHRRLRGALRDLHRPAAGGLQHHPDHARPVRPPPPPHPCRPPGGCRELTRAPRRRRLRGRGKHLDAFEKVDYLYTAFNKLYLPVFSYHYARFAWQVRTRRGATPPTAASSRCFQPPSAASCRQPPPPPPLYSNYISLRLRSHA